MVTKMTRVTRVKSIELNLKLNLKLVIKLVIKL